MSEKDIHGNNYNAHPETARNKWFNYSDAYIDKDGENQPVADYQEQFAQSVNNARDCLLYTSPSPRDTERSRMPSSA